MGRQPAADCTLASRGDCLTSSFSCAGPLTGVSCLWRCGHMGQWPEWRLGHPVARARACGWLGGAVFYLEILSVRGMRQPAVPAFPRASCRGWRRVVRTSRSAHEMAFRRYALVLRRSLKRMASLSALISLRCVSRGLRPPLVYDARPDLDTEAPDGRFAVCMSPSRHHRRCCPRASVSQK